MVDIQYNKEQIVIIGAGGLGRELASWFLLDNKIQKKYIVKGFLDDNLHALDSINFKFNILDKVTNKAVSSYSYVIIALADIKNKKNIIENIIEHSNAKLMSYIFENVLIGLNTEIGKGVVIAPSVIVSCNILIGNGVFINIGSQIGHDVIIGNYVSIMANVDIGGGAIIEDEVFIGSGAVILPGVVIPRGTRIGAGSVVLRSIKKVGTYFGNPAMKIL